MDENEISRIIVGAAIEIHRILGPGLLESVYQSCMKKELVNRGLNFESEVPIYAEYKGELLQEAYRLDLIVENKVVIELKAIERLAAKHTAQLLTYLRLSNKKLGLLINFNEATLKSGLMRVVNDL